MTCKKAARAPKKRRQERDITSEIIAFPTASEMVIRPFKWTEKQQKVIDAALDPNTKMILIKGSAGCGKTLLAVYCALVLFKERARKKINYVRIPLEASQHKIGFLPSTMAEKMTPHLAPCMDHLREMIDENQIQSLLNEEKVVAIPLGFLKGTSLSNCSVIFDECEDGTLKEFELMMGRMGRNSILFACGDERQSNVKENGFHKVFDAFSGEDSKKMGIHTFTFEASDCLRSPMLSFILNKMEQIR